VDWFGPVDLWAEYNEALAKQPTDPSAQVVVTWTPIVFGSSQAAMQAASPVTYIAAGDPPFIIQQGTLDQMVFPDQSEELVDALQLAAVTYQLVWVQNAGHGFVSQNGLPISPSLSQIANQDVSFLQAHDR
jgi:dipeptidyl aminopeptidase/acylaminoacyl peptidase